MLALLLSLTAAVPLSAPRTLVVGAGGFATIDAALRAARGGERIEVRGGLHRGPIVVEKSLELVGIGKPKIDGGGTGTVVTLAAPHSRIAGFEIVGSGDEPDLDHSGITVKGAHSIVEQNVLDEVLFGVFVAQADGAIVRDNEIGSKSRFEQGRRGDAIRLWYSAGVSVERNFVHDARDVVIWYSKETRVTGNRIVRGRYGVHLMYCNDLTIENNTLRDNAVGIYDMYSKRVKVTGNDIRSQRGPSGYALGFMDADDVEVADNTLIDNRAAIFAEGTPFTPGAFARFEANIIAFNDQGAVLSPSTLNALFRANSFWENIEQVAVHGGGDLTRNRFEGNYWSDDSGFDLDRDGTRDQPYRAERVFESLTDREPNLRMLLYSPAAEALELAGAAFPVVLPQPKLSDPTPRAEPLPLPSSTSEPKGESLAFAGLLLIGIALLAAWPARRMEVA